MNDLRVYKGYHAKVEIDFEGHILHGKIDNFTAQSMIILNFVRQLGNSQLIRSMSLSSHRYSV